MTTRMIESETSFPRILALRVTMRSCEPQVLPPFLGTCLHGALGWALRRTICPFPARSDCASCPILRACSYPQLFDTPAPGLDELRLAGIRERAPKPLVIAPEAGWLRSSGKAIKVGAGEEIPFRVTLVGRATDELHLVVAALLRVAEKGMGLPLRSKGAEEDKGSNGKSRRRRAKLELVRITEADGTSTEVYDGDTDQFTTPEVGSFVADSCDLYRVTVEFITPLRLKKRGHIASIFSAADFFGTLAKRANALSQAHESGEPALDIAEVLEISRSILLREVSLRLVHVRRFSASQKRPMEWPGLVGILSLEGTGVGRLWPLLRFGELVQVGKATTFGFGRYRILGGRVLTP